jgi:hypothetical protein
LFSLFHQQKIIAWCSLCILVLNALVTPNGSIATKGPNGKREFVIRVWNHACPRQYD